MEDYSIEEDPYEIDFYESEHEEESPGWSDEENDYDEPPWPGDEPPNPSHESESDVEPEPPDYSPHNDHQRWYQEEENNEETDSQLSLEEINSRNEDSWHHEAETEECFGTDSEREEETRPWYEVPYSDHEEEHQEESNPQYTQGEIAEEEEVESEDGGNDSREDYTEEDGDISEKPRYINFSGHSQGPDAYIQWENEMEEWFVTNQISEEEKTTIAEETLTEDAFNHWDRDAYLRLDCEVPDATWQDMKSLMYDEFVKDTNNMRRYYAKVGTHRYTNPNLRRLIFATRPTPKQKPRKAHKPHPKGGSTQVLKERSEAKYAIQAKDTPKPNPQGVPQKQKLEPHGKIKHCKSPKSKEVICYRCHQGGHYAANCTTRQLEKSLKPDISNIQTGFETSSSSIMLLSMPKVDNAGLMMEQEATEAIRSLELEKQQPRTTFQIQVSDTYEFNKYCKNIMITRSLKNVVLSTYVPSIMHLIFPLSVKERTGTFKRRKSTSNRLMSYQKEGRQTSNPIPGKSKVSREEMIFEETSLKNVNNNVPIKEKPPDFKKTPNAPSDTKSSWTQGMTLNTQRRMKANLLSLSADYQVSRSKLCQGGGYDEVIRSDLIGEHTRGRAETEETPSTRTSTHSAHSFNMGFKIHPQIMHFRSNDRARTQLERFHEEPTPECLTRAITEPRELYIEEYTRAFITRHNIHSKTIHLEDFCRTKPPNYRDGIEDTQRSLPGVAIKPRKLSLEESTRASSLYLCIHSKMTYFEGLGRAKLPKEPANWKESNLKQFGRFALSEPTNPDRRLSSHALMFSNTNLKTTCCFRMPKTTRKPAPRICPRGSHLPYTDLPYLDKGAFKPQRLLSDPLRHESRHNQDLQTVPRHSSFGPKLSRLKPSRNLPYLT